MSVVVLVALDPDYLSNADRCMERGIQTLTAAYNVPSGYLCGS
jgi:hypothetical protein